MENNNIVLSGTVKDELRYSHTIYGEDFYTAPLEVKRNSGVNDMINILISDRILFQDERLLGEFIYAYGSIRTKNNPGDRKLCVNALIDSIDVIPTENALYGYENCARIKGFICKINSLRNTPSGRTVCDIIVAVNRPYGRNDYIPCIFWGKNAKYISECNVGEEIEIIGRLQSRNYTKNNEEQTTYELSVQTFNIITGE